MPLLYELLERALPNDIDKKLFHRLIKDKWDIEKPINSLYEIISLLKDIDWDAYLDQYQDVKKAGIDPIIHFLSDGIFENRKLILKRNNFDIYINNIQPKVSVIVPNYNNGLYLEKCLSSLKNQTLTNIEIIIIDDNSSDISLEIINRYIISDKRFKLIQKKYTESQHMARIDGVKAANGKYIMFLDADDFYAANACEVAYDAVQKKYDIAAFNFKLIIPDDTDLQAVERYKRYALRDNELILEGKEIVNAIFNTGIVTPHITNKIFKADICKKAFSQLESGNYTRGEDNYEMIALAANSNSLIQIIDELYYHPIFMGLSTFDDSSYKIKHFIQTGEIWSPIERYVINNNIDIDLKKYKNIHLINTINPLLNNITPSIFAKYINEISKQYGILYFIKTLMYHNFTNWKKISDSFFTYKANIKQRKKNICIYIHILTYNNFILLKNLIEILSNTEYKLFLIIELQNIDIDINLPEVDIMYIATSLEYKTNLININLDQLKKYLDEKNIEILLFLESWSQALLWQIILAKMMGIAVFAYENSSYYEKLLDRQAIYNLNQKISVLKCVDVLLIPTLESELFYRINGVNAEYIGYPIKTNDIKNNYIEKKYSFFSIIDLSNPLNQPYDVLYILKAAIKIQPKINALFLILCNDSKKINNFKNRAQQLDIFNNMTLVYSLNSIEKYFLSSHIYLCTNYCDGLSYNEKLAINYNMDIISYSILPQVDIEFKKINAVSPQEFKQAAHKVVDLLNDKTAIYSQSVENKDINTTRENFLKIFTNVISSYETSSKLTYYNSNLYKNIMKKIAYYSSNIPPSN